MHKYKQSRSGWKERKGNERKVSAVGSVVGGVCYQRTGIRDGYEGRFGWIEGGFEASKDPRIMDLGIECYVVSISYVDSKYMVSFIHNHGRVCSRLSRVIEKVLLECLDYSIHTYVLSLVY